MARSGRHRIATRRQTERSANSCAAAGMLPPRQGRGRAPGSRRNSVDEGPGVRRDREGGATRMGANSAMPQTGRRTTEPASVAVSQQRAPVEVKNGQPFRPHRPRHISCCLSSASISVLPDHRSRRLVEPAVPLSLASPVRPSFRTPDRVSSPACRFSLLASAFTSVDLRPSIPSSCCTHEQPLPLRVPSRRPLLNSAGCSSPCSCSAREPADLSVPHPEPQPASAAALAPAIHHICVSPTSRSVFAHPSQSCDPSEAEAIDHIQHLGRKKVHLQSMGDRFQFSPHAEAQPAAHVPIPPPIPTPPNHHHHHHHSYPHEITNIEEDDGEIKCVCGYADDDGSTVLCEKCNTWQHVECYYFPTRVVPDVHQCVNCFPRFIDSTGATLRQQQLRETVVTNDERRPKRPGPKGSRRVKAKELSNGTAQPNGLPHGQPDHQNGAWEQPPAKRAKTTHRNSTSQSLNSNGRLANQRNRSSSNATSAITKVKPPLAQCPPDYFSPEFIRVHQFTEGFRPAQGNAHLNIGITDLLSRWLDDPDEFAAATNDKKHSQVFKHYDQPIEQLQTPIQKHFRQDTSCVFHGKHPVWPYLTVDQDLYEGDFVGEVFGTIGHIEDYKRDADNQWDRLRHPDHFVFFHPHLPIYIDCRTEGTILRHARRSCDPNLTMETLITGARDYHFCLTALKDIPKGTEITIRWDMHSDPQLWQCLEHLSHGPLDEEEKSYIQDWVGTVLAHFGGCACSGTQCMLDRFDHRAPRISVELPSSAPKTTRRKRASRKSPPTTLLIRGGGDDVQQFDNAEDIDDSRSVSHSNRSQSSREATPAGHGAKRKAADEGLSQRDRKKLQQEERLFAKQEHDRQHGKRGSRKRTSGSNAHTPAAAVSKQLGRSASASSPNTPAPGTKMRSLHNGTSYFDTPPVSQRSSVSRTSQRRPGSSSSHSMASPTSKPIYVDAETQTDPIDEPIASRPRKQYMTLAQRLLRRHRSQLTTRNNLNINQTGQPIDPTATSVSDPLKEPPTEVKATSESPYSSKSNESREVQMQDVESEPALTAEVKEQADNSAEPSAHTPKVPQRPLEPPDLPASPPALPWSDPNAESPPLTQRRALTRAANMHVDLPAPSFQAPVPIMSASPTPGAPTATIESPNPGTQFTPLVAAMSPAPLNSQPLPTFVQPSPVKKRISLSDYMKKKGSTPGIEKSQAQALQDRGSSSPTITKLASPGRQMEDDGSQSNAVRSDR